MGTLKAEDVGRKQNCLWPRSPQSLVALIYTCSFAHGSSQTSEPCSLPLTKPHTVSFTHSVLHSFSILRSFFLSNWLFHLCERGRFEIILQSIWSFLRLMKDSIEKIIKYFLNKYCLPCPGSVLLEHLCLWGTYCMGLAKSFVQVFL